MKNSFSLLEIILTLIISSIVIIYSTLFAKNLFFENKINEQIEIQKIDLLSTKIFFEKHLNQIDEFNFSNENLYFQNNLLLENVKEFDLIKLANNTTIFINLDNKIVQTWQFSQ
jgi:type II secretory pathway component PulJ